MPTGQTAFLLCQVDGSVLGSPGTFPVSALEVLPPGNLFPAPPHTSHPRDLPVVTVSVTPATLDSSRRSRSTSFLEFVVFHWQNQFQQKCQRQAAGAESWVPGFQERRVAASCTWSSRALELWVSVWSADQQPPPPPPLGAW